MHIHDAVAPTKVHPEENTSNITAVLAADQHNQTTSMHRSALLRCCPYLLIQAKHVVKSPLLGVQTYARGKLRDNLGVGF
jgi:hypothetical protein